MIRDTRSPVLFASWKATGSRPTCSCTLIRMSAISFCAAFDMSCTSANELSAWTTVAATTAPTSGTSSSVREWPMTSSIRNLVEPGSTSPATRLTAISRNARASSRRRGRTSAHTSGRSARRRSGLRPRADCFDSRVATLAAPLTAAFYRGPAGTPREEEASPRLDSGGANSCATRRPRSPSPFGLAGRTELLDDSPQVVDASTADACDDRAVQPVQETFPAAASDEQGDEVAGRSVVQNPHHAGENTQAAYRGRGT